MATRLEIARAAQKKFQEETNGLNDEGKELYTLQSRLNSLSSWQDQKEIEEIKNELSSIQRKQAIKTARFGGSKDSKGYKILQEQTEALNSISSWLDERAEVYGKYKSAEDYSLAVKDNEELTKLYAMSSEEIAPYLVTEEDKKKKKEYDALKKKRDDLYGQLYSKHVKNGVNTSLANKMASEDSKIVDYDKQLSAYGDIGNIDTSGIAYTTSDGQNITWQSLYDSAKAKEDFDALYKEYSSKDDWEEAINRATSYKNPSRDKAEPRMVVFGHGVGGTDEPINKLSYLEENLERILLSADHNYGGSNVVDSRYRHLTDKEKAIYHYYWGRGEYDEAEKYLDSMLDEVVRREDDRQISIMVEMTEEVPVLPDALSVVANLAAPVEYLGDALRGDVGDRNTMAAMSSAIRSARAEQIDWEIGNWDAFDFIYNTGMSTVDSAASMLLFGEAGGVMLGLSAAAQGTNDALNRGMSKNQAFWNGLMSGVFEGVFESLQIGAFTDLTKHLKNIDVKNIAKYIGKNMWNNAKEETLTEIANIAYDTIINGDFSQAETAIRQYMNQGLSEEDAKRKVALELGGQIAEAAGSGALMGIGFSAGGSAVSAYHNVQAGKTLNAKGANAVNALVDIGKSYSPNSAVYQLAEKVQQKPSNLNVGGLVRSAMDVSSNTLENIADELVRRGIDAGEAREFAKQMIKQAEGGKMSKKSADAIMGDADLKDVYETFVIGADQFPAILAEHLEEQIASSPAKENSVQSTYKLAADGKTANLKTGDAVTVKKIDSISSSGDVKLTLDDGTVVKASDLAYGSDAEAIFIENISNIKLGKKSIGTTSANALYQAAMSALKNNPDMTADEAMSLIKGLEEAYVYGVYNLGRSRLTSRNKDGSARLFAGELSQEQRKFAYELGTQDAVSKAESDQKVIDELKAKVDTEASKKSLGKVIFEKGAEVEDESALTATQKANLDGIKLLAQISSVEFHVFRSEKVGNTYKFTMPDGTVTSANGWFVAGTNEIWIDLNAGNAGEGTMIRTAAHEISHYIRQWSPKKWRAMADLLMKSFAENDVDTESMLNRQVAKIKRRYKANKKSMPSQSELIDIAYEELVSDALSDMLTDGSIVNFIAEVKAKDRNLAQKILDAIKSLLNKWGLIIDDYKGRDLDTPEAQALSQLEDTFKKLQEMYRDAFVDANEAAVANDIANIDADNNVEFSERDSEDIKRFARDIDQWNRDKRPNDESFILGSTGDVLQGLGAIESDIYMLGEKINEILLTHPEMTLDEIKKIPQILDNPILILKSKAKGRGNRQNTRLVIFGSVKAKDNRPVLSVLDLRPREDNLVIDDMQKVTSAYTKDNNPVDFVRNSDVVYADKKKTTKLLRTIGFQMPIELQLSGYIGSISYKGQNVNIEGEAFSSVFKEESENLYSERESSLYEGQIKYSERQIVGESGTNYGVGVYLDSNLLTGLTESERKQMVKEFVISELAGQRFIAYDNNKDAVAIEIAKKSDKVKKNKVLNELHHKNNDIIIKQEAIVLIDELIANAKYNKSKSPNHSHDWLDNYGKNNWDYWKAFIQEKNRTVWEATLNVATTANGKKILYDIKPIKKVEEGIKSPSTSTNDIIRQDNGKSQEKLSDRDSGTSSRAILANALEGTATNDIERKKLAEYKEKIVLIETEKQRLSNIQKQLFTKGAVDSERRKDLQFEAKQIANRINTYDRRLLNLESTTALKNVLNREKALAMKRQKQKDTEYLKQYKEKVAKTQRELLERNQESRKKAIESRSKTAMRHKIKNVVNDLNNLLLKPSKERHVPEELRMAVSEALSVVNMDTVDAETRVAHYNDLIAKAKDPDVIASLTETRNRILEQGTKLSDKLTKLKEAYEMVRDSADDSVKSMYDDVIYSRIQTVKNKVGKTPIRNMTLEQLESVYDLYKMVLTTVRDSNKAFAENLTMSRLALGSNTFAEIKENNKARDTIKHPSLEKFMWQNLKPMQAMKTIGSGILQKLWNNILYGQETFAVDYYEAVEFAKEMKEKHGYKKWNKDKLYSFESKSGKAMKLNLEQMMSIYAYSKRAQADEHIEYGGIVLNEGVRKIKNKLGKVVEVKVNDSTAYRLDEMQVEDIVATLEKEFPGAKAFVDDMQKYLSETMGAKGNEVSMKMYGIKLFKEEHYFPLKSSKDFMEAANAKLKGDVKIKNKGMTKSVVEHARNPIVLENFLDVWGNHINEMALYHGLVLPLEDFSRTLNYSFKADEKLNTDAESVRTALHDAFGDNADNYLNELLKAINGGVLHDSSSQFADKMISKFKKAKVMASLSVIVQQPTAIIRAMGVIEPKYFVAQNFNHKATWEELKKYCPTAIIKETGSFDTNMGKTIVDMVKEESGFVDKVGDVLGKAPAYMDEVGWNMIWRALKKKVASEQNLSGETLLRECGKQMTLIINETQVYDSVMSRNELMRSKNALTKMATAFGAEPSTVANMIYGAALDFKRGKKGIASKTVAATITSVVVNGLVSAMVYALRDDDEEKTLLEKYLSSATSEVLDGLNPLTYIPFVKDAYSLFQGYKVERTDMALIKDVVDAINDFYNVLDPEAYEDMSKDEIARHIYDNSVPLLTSICDMFGLPVGNILRDAEAIIINDNVPVSRTSSSGIGYAFKEGALSVLPKIVQKIIGTDSKQDKLYDAISNGDDSRLETIKGNYSSEEAYNNAIKDVMKRLYGKGEMSESEAISWINELYPDYTDADIYWKLKEWKMIAEHEGDEDYSYSKYGEFFDAIDSGDTIAMNRCIQEFRAHNNRASNKEVASDIASAITSHYKPLYTAASSSERAALKEKVIEAHLALGYSRSTVVKKINNWSKD